MNARFHNRRPTGAEAEAGQEPHSGAPVRPCPRHEPRFALSVRPGPIKPRPPEPAGGVKVLGAAEADRRSDGDYLAQSTFLASWPGPG